MTKKTVVLTSYNVPQELKDKINAMETIEEVAALQNSVKSPNKCETGDPDLTVWWACAAVLDEQDKENAKREHAPMAEAEVSRLEWLVKNFQSLEENDWDY